MKLDKHSRPGYYYAIISITDFRNAIKKIKNIYIYIYSTIFKCSKHMIGHRDNLLSTRTM